MYAAIEPADVYARVVMMQATILILAAMIVLQVIGKFLIFRKVVDLLCRNEALGERVERLLTYVERHGTITDAQKDRTEKVISRATTEIKHTVEGVPEVTAEKTVEKLKEITDSGPHPKPVEPPQSRTPGLPLILWPIYPLLILSSAGATLAAMSRVEEPTVFTRSAVTAFDSASRQQMDGKWADATESYREAQKAGYSPVETLYGIAECGFYQGNYGQTLKACEQLKNLPDGEARSRFWKAHVLFKSGREKEALWELELSCKGGFPPAGRLLAHKLSRSNG